MVWRVAFHEAFADEFAALDPEVQVGVEAGVIAPRAVGPRLARPHADTLTGSKHANMKELRFKAAVGVWRVAFAFDPSRRGSCSLPEVSRGDRKSGSTGS